MEASFSKNTREEYNPEESLIEKYGLEEKHELVVEERGKAVYAHTVYHEIELYDYEQFITEDDTPVDNIFSEKQQRLLVDPLRVNEWTGRKFMAASNVGIYYEGSQFPIIPDMFLSMDVVTPTNWKEKKNRCYFVWRFGKPPELVVEVVSNKIGGENKSKFAIYSEIGVKYYIIQDPFRELYQEEINVFILNEETQKYETYEKPFSYIPELALGVRLWKGLFEDGEDTEWMRWCDKDGNILQTGAEKSKQLAEEKEQLAEEKEQLAEEKEQLAEEKEQLAKEKETEKKGRKDAEAKVEALMKRLADLGLEPEK